MINELDLQIDLSLKRLYNSENGVSKSSDIAKINIIGENNIVTLLSDRGLATELEDKENFPFGLKIPTCRISEKGIEISKNGGWIKYLKREKLKSEMLDEKLKHDLRISKLKSKTFVPLLFLGAFGGIYSIIKVIILVLNMLHPKQPLNPSLHKQETKANKITQTEYHTLSDVLNSQEYLKNHFLYNFLQNIEL